MSRRFFRQPIEHCTDRPPHRRPDFLSNPLAEVIQYGTLDRTFGREGLATTRVGFITDDVVSHLALQSDGRIVVATTRPTERADVCLFRYRGE